MKLILSFACLALPTMVAAEAEDPAAAPARHKHNAHKLALEQDELAADVQTLRIQQTAEPVIVLLEEVEDAMADATDLLDAANTGGETIAAQTDVIEKIFAAAQKRSEQRQGEGESSTSGAMLDMMQGMMGNAPGGTSQRGQAAGSEGGEGTSGESETPNVEVTGEVGGETEERRVPKAAGRAGAGLPAEFQQALEAYNRAAAERLQTPSR